MRKKIIVAAISAFALVGTTSVFAGEIKQYVLTKMSTSIVIDGQKYVTTSPILNHKGTTYIPLREAGKLLGKVVVWNAKQKQIEISEDYFFIDGSAEFSSPKKEFVNLINEHVKAINQKDKTAYQLLYTAEGFENFPSMPANKIVITNHFIFENTTTDKTDVKVDQYFKEGSEVKYTQAQYLLVKENNQWKIAGFSQ
ncbi:MAG: stalk domain-containing protein [Bacillota bacterium]